MWHKQKAGASVHFCGNGKALSDSRTIHVVKQLLKKHADNGNISRLVDIRNRKSPGNWTESSIGDFKDMLMDSLKLFPAREGNSLAAMLYIIDLLASKKVKDPGLNSNWSCENERGCHRVDLSQNRQSLVQTEFTVTRLREENEPVLCYHEAGIQRCRRHGEESREMAKSVNISRLFLPDNNATDVLEDALKRAAWHGLGKAMHKKGSADKNANESTMHAKVLGEGGQNWSDSKRDNKMIDVGKCLKQSDLMIQRFKNIAYDNNVCGYSRKNVPKVKLEMCLDHGPQRGEEPFKLVVAEMKRRKLGKSIRANDRRMRESTVTKSMFVKKS